MCFLKGNIAFYNNNSNTIKKSTEYVHLNAHIINKTLNNTSNIFLLKDSMR